MRKVHSILPQLSVADRSVSRVINRAAIVDKIYQCAGISKAQLAKELGISKPAVSSHVASLISVGLVEEIGEGEAAKNGGRKPKMLYFNATHRYVGALDLSLREPVCAVGDLRYNIVGLRKIKLGKAATAAQRKQGVLDAFSEILDAKGLSPDCLGMIIISQPGIITNGAGEYYSSKRHHAWTKIGLKRYLCEEMQIPVAVFNDMNMAAIGEMHFGLDRRLNDLIYLSSGVGLGAGIVMDGALYEGKRRAAGEIGWTLMDDGRTAEDALAMDGLIKKVEGLGRGGEITFPYIVKMAKAGDGEIRQIVYETGREFGKLISGYCAVLDIPTVIFGGEYLQLGQSLFDGLNDVLIEAPVFCPTVLPSRLKQIAGIFGGFVVGKDRIIQSLLAPQNSSANPDTERSIGR